MKIMVELNTHTHSRPQESTMPVVYPASIPTVFLPERTLVLISQPLILYTAILLWGTCSRTKPNCSKITPGGLLRNVFGVSIWLDSSQHDMRKSLLEVPRKYFLTHKPVSSAMYPGLCGRDSWHCCSHRAPKLEDPSPGAGWWWRWKEPGLLILLNTLKGPPCLWISYHVKQ